MSERRMFELSFNRPHNYFSLNPDQQWKIDDNLGILDWLGYCAHDNDLPQCKECHTRYKEHYTLNL